jgi:hypothetical protein
MLAKLKSYFARCKLRPISSTSILHHVFHGMHGVYFGAVFLEAHGFYAITGGAMLVLLVLNYFLHFD